MLFKKVAKSRRILICAKIPRPLWHPLASYCFVIISIILYFLTYVFSLFNPAIVIAYESFSTTGINIQHIIKHVNNTIFIVFFLEKIQNSIFKIITQIIKIILYIKSIFSLYIPASDIYLSCTDSLLIFTPYEIPLVNNKIKINPITTVEIICIFLLLNNFFIVITHF